MEKDAHRNVLVKVAEVVERFASDGRHINVTMEADRLLQSHPDWQVPEFQIIAELTRLATERGLAIEFGPPPGD